MRFIERVVDFPMIQPKIGPRHLA